MVIKTPPQIKRFARFLGDALDRRHLGVVVMFLTGILLASGKRTLAAIGRAAVLAGRYRGTVSRVTRSKAFKTREIYTAAAEAVTRLASQARRRVRGLFAPDREAWVIAIDDVATLRGGMTKIENGLHKREPNETPGKKSTPSSKSLVFVMGLLITAKGVRIPLPRKTWRTKAYARKLGRKYVSKVSLGIQMVRDALKLVPPDIDVVVLADSLYDTSEFMASCRRLGVRLITPLDSGRVFADMDERRFQKTSRKVHERGQQLPSNVFEKVALDPSSEGTASYRRRTANGSRERGGLNGRRVYRVAHERRGVAGLGLVGVVYSWKCPVFRPRVCWERESFKVLVCSDPDVPAALVVEVYELRWQVEILFREIKGGLGLGHYLGTSFEAFERLVDMTLLSYLLLEWQRLDPKRRDLADARLATLKREVERDGMRADLRRTARWLRSGRGRKRIGRVLERLQEAA